jgi:hypothetical protein
VICTLRQVQGAASSLPFSYGNFRTMYNQNNQVEEDEMGGSGSNEWGRRRTRIGYW